MVKPPFRFFKLLSGAAVALLMLGRPAMAQQGVSVHDGWSVDLSDEGCSMERSFANGDIVGMYMAPGDEALFFYSKGLTGVHPGESMLTLRSAGKEQAARAMGRMLNGLPGYSVDFKVSMAAALGLPARIEVLRDGAPIITLDFSGSRAALKQLATC